MKPRLLKKRGCWRLRRVTLLGVILITGSFHLHAATGVWDGSESGTWTDNDNWESGTAPIDGDSLQFGSASNYTVSSSPSLTFNGGTFTSDAEQYIISGSATFSGDTTVQESAIATSHLLAVTYSTNGATFDIQGNTSLELYSINYGGSSSNLTKSGSGTLEIWDSADDVGSYTINEGTVLSYVDIGQSSDTEMDANFRLSGTNSSALLTNDGSADITLTFGAEGSDGSSASFAGSITGMNVSVAFGASADTDGLGVTQTFTSTSANTYTGTTDITYGTMIMNGSHIGGDSYTLLGDPVNATGIMLGGSGVIELTQPDADFTILGNDFNTATLYPGANDTDTETLTLEADDLILSIDTILELDIGAGGESDSLLFIGNVTISTFDTELLLNSLSGAFEDNSTYTLLTYTGTFTGSFETITGLDANYVLDYGSGTNDAITIYSTIPEPSSAAMIALGLAAFALRDCLKTRQGSR